MTKGQFKSADQDTTKLEAEHNAFHFHTIKDLSALFRQITVFSEEISQLLSKSGTEMYIAKSDINKYVQFINKSGRKGIAVIDALHDYSNLDHSAIKYTTIDLNSLITEITTKLTGFEALERFHITYKDLPTIISDRHLLSRVFYELIKNSILYCSNDKNPEVVIDVDSDEDNWQLRVTDSGTEFTLGAERRIFDILTRIHRDQNPSGLGMGLAISQKCIQLLGGKITAQPTEKHGLCIEFYIPKTRPEMMN